MASIFTKIINNQTPCYKVAEDENFIAFLDINPNARGHTLCIPKKEIDDYLDLDDETFKDLMYFSKKVAVAIKNVIKCKKVGLRAAIDTRNEKINYKIREHSNAKIPVILVVGAKEQENEMRQAVISLMSDRLGKASS